MFQILNFDFMDELGKVMSLFKLHCWKKGWEIRIKGYGHILNLA